MTRPHLQSAVLFAAQFSLPRYLLKTLCQIQFKLIVAALRLHPAVLKIYLRRSGVLKDLYPGDSDFDLTLVIEEKKLAAVSVSRLLRILKRIFPMLGETVLIFPNDFSHYKEHRFTSFWNVSPLLLYERHEESASWSSGPAVHDRYLTLGELLRNSLWAALSKSPPRFSRDLLKLSAKLHWAKTPQGELRYLAPEFSKGIFLDPKRRNEMVSSLNLDFSRCEWNDPSAEVCLELVGELSPPSENDVATIRSILEPLGNPIPDVHLTQFRLYSFSRCLVIRERLPPSRVLQEIRQRLCESQVFLAFEYLLPLDEDGEKAWRTLDPLAASFSSLGYFSFRENRWCCSAQSTLKIRKTAMLYELSTAISLVNSILRRNDPVYLTVLLWGLIAPLNRALQSSKLHLSFSTLRPLLNIPQEAKAIAQAFEGGDHKTLSRYTAFDIYRQLQPQLFEELQLSRQLLGARA